MKIKILSVCGVILTLVLIVAIAIDALFPIRYYGAIKKSCKEYGIEPALVLAVIWTESKFRADAVSGAGACGLMQLMPSTAKWLNGDEEDTEKLFMPEQNIDMGVRYLAYLKGKFEGDYVLAAYNAGEGNVAKWLEGDGEIKFAETKDYINKVNALTKLYRLRTAS